MLKNAVVQWHSEYLQKDFPSIPTPDWSAPIVKGNEEGNDFFKGDFPDGIISDPTKAAMDILEIPLLWDYVAEKMETRTADNCNKKFRKMLNRDKDVLIRNYNIFC